EEETELGCGLAVDPERHRAEDRRPRPADPRDHRDALDQPDEDRLAHRHIRDPADVPCLREPLDEQNRKAPDDQRPGHYDGIFEHQLDIIAEREAEDDRREKGEQQVAHEGDGDRIAAKEAGEHLPEQLPVQHHDREDRPRLDRNVEDRPTRGVIAEKFRRQNQVPRRGNGQKLGETLDDAEDDRGQPDTHYRAASSAKRPWRRYWTSQPSATEASEAGVTPSCAKPSAPSATTLSRWSISH